jgi:hypothetical protein
MENSKYVVAFGRCEGRAEYGGYAVGQVFVKHETKLIITASGNSFVMIDLFDNAKIEVEAKDNAKICVNRYGGSVTPLESGKATVKIVQKQSKTYQHGIIISN